MAVDTRDKRFSMIGFMADTPWIMANPDGTIGAGDRAMLLNLYAGISLSEDTDLMIDVELSDAATSIVVLTDASRG